MQIESVLRKCSVEELRPIALEIRVQQDQVTDKSKIEVMRAISDVIDGLADDDQKMTTMKRMIPAAPNNVMPMLCSVLTGEKKEVSSSSDQTLKILGALTGNTASAFRRDLKFSGTIDS